MKARPNPLSLVLTISFFAFLAIMVARADHTTGVMEGAPEPVQECYATAQIYQQLIITRQAGLSLEEVLDYHKYTMRIVKYVTESAGEEYTDSDATKHNDRTREVYAIPDDDLASNAYLQDWVTGKFEGCIDLIPDVIEPHDTQSIDRMLPPNE